MKATDAAIQPSITYMGVQIGLLKSDLQDVKPSHKGCLRSFFCCSTVALYFSVAGGERKYWVSPSPSRCSAGVGTLHTDQRCGCWPHLLPRSICWATPPPAPRPHNCQVSSTENHGGLTPELCGAIHSDTVLECMGACHGLSAKAWSHPLMFRELLPASSRHPRYRTEAFTTQPDPSRSMT